MTLSNMSKNDRFSVEMDLSNGFRELDGSSTTVVQEVSLLPFPADATIELGYLAIDYGLRGTVGADIILEWYIAFGEAGESGISIAELADRSLWHALQLWLNATGGDMVQAASHEESWVNATYQTPRQFLSGFNDGLWLYSVVSAGTANWIAVGRVEAVAHLNQRYWSDTYTRNVNGQRKRFTHGWQGFSFEETDPEEA